MPHSPNHSDSSEGIPQESGEDATPGPSNSEIPVDMSEGTDQPSSPTLGKKTARGAMWMSLATFVARSLGSIRLIALAAVVPQAELGLFGIAIVVMMLVERLSETGIRAALIQKTGDVEPYLGTAWLSQLARGLFLGAIIFFAAGWIENFFEKPGLAELLRILSLLPILQGIQNVGILFLHRELDFSKVVIIQMATTLVDLTVSVSLALIWPSAMSLVVGRLLATLVAVVLSFALERRHAPLTFSVLQFRELYKFGFWVFASTILSFTLVSGGDLVIGKLLTVEDLAIYQVAYGMACIPVIQVMSVISVTTFSAYSRIQNDAPRLRSAFLRVLALASFIAVFSVVGAITLGYDFVELFFNENYALVSTMLPWLAVWGACRALGSTNTVLFQAIGRPALATVFQFLMVVMFVAVLIPMAVFYGTFGVVYSLVAIGVCAQIGRYVFLAHVLEVPLFNIVIRVLVPIGIGTVSVLGTFLVLNLIDGQHHVARLLVGLISISIIYFAGTLIVDRRCRFGIADFASGQFKFLKRFLPAATASSH